MLVEDDPDLRVYLTGLLIGDGWGVTAHGDAEAAFASVLPDNVCPPIGLLLTDVMPPGCSARNWSP
jgi:DNA-binding response OmpR family regulator